MNWFSLASICFFQFVSSFAGVEHWWLTSKAFEQVSQTTEIDVNHLHLRNDLKVSVGTFSHFFGYFVGPAGYPPLCDRSSEQIQRFFERVIAETSPSVVNKVNLVRQREWEILLSLQANKSDFVRPFLGNGKFGKETEQDYCRASRDEEPYLNSPRPVSSWNEDVVLRPSPFVEFGRVNYDHFQANGCAQRTYTHLHSLAWRYIRDMKQLDLGLAAEAAALHYLTDAFSSGNIRTQRALVQRQCTGSEGWGLSQCQHDEDDALGLSVENIRRDTWTAFGNHFLFTTQNKRNLELILEAMEKSVSEIFEKRVTNAALLLIPSVIHDANFAPLFSPHVFSVYVRDPFGPGIKKPRKDVTYTQQLGSDNCASLLSRCNVRARYAGDVKPSEGHYDSVVITGLLAFGGLALVFYGIRLFRGALFFVGFSFCFGGSLLVLAVSSDHFSYLELLLALSLGVLGGFVVLAIERAAFCLLGLSLGLVLASLVDTGVFRNFIDPRVATVLSFVVFGVVGCLVSKFVEELIIAVATSLVGAYIFARSLSGCLGYWPITEWWVEGHSAEMVPWQWYLSATSIFLLAAFGVVFQLNNSRSRNQLPT